MAENSRQKIEGTLIWVSNISEEFRDRHTALEKGKGKGKGKESESESISESGRDLGKTVLICSFCEADKTPNQYQ